MSRRFALPRKLGDLPPATLGVLQRKLAIGSSNDPLEHEADRVADQVLSGSRPSALGAAVPRIQRRGDAAGDFSGEAPESVTRTLSGAGAPLEAGLREDMGARFGHDFSSVRVHQGGVAEQSAKAVGARAYTVGQNIVFGAGEFAPHSADGRRLIAHELTHTVQQGDGGGGKALLQRALGPVLDKVQTLMSYSAGDWAIRDSEAMEALALLGSIPPASLAAELAKLESKYVTRLLDNLPDAAKSGEIYQRVIAALGPTGVMPYAKDQLDTGPLDWAVTDTEVTNVFNTFANMAAPAQEKFLADLNATKRLGVLISNSNTGHHALYIRPWIATLTRGALTDQQRAILKTIVTESDDDALETMKLATAVRFDVTVEKRPIPRRTAVEWDPSQLRQTYLILDALPEAHVGKNKELLHLAQFNEPSVQKGDTVSTVAGIYFPGRQLLTANVVSSPGFAQTIRHETAHAVDQQLGWSTGAEPAKPQRGGWKSYGANYVSCATDMVDDSAGTIKTTLTAPQRTDVIGAMAAAMTNRSAAGLETAIRALPWFAALKDPDKAAVVADKALKAVATGLNTPWSSATDGGDQLGIHIYQEGYPNDWVRYEYQARSRKISDYQFRDPGEWFAECYAEYYEPDKRGKGAKLNDKDPNTKAYFDTTVDTLPASR